MADQKQAPISPGRVFVATICALTGASLFRPLGIDPINAAGYAALGAGLFMWVGDKIYLAIFKNNNSDLKIQTDTANGPEINVYNADTGELIGELSEEQKKFIMKKFKRINDAPDTYHFNRGALVKIEINGADEVLLRLLHKALAEKYDCNIRIVNETLLINEPSLEPQQITALWDKFDPIAVENPAIAFSTLDGVWNIVLNNQSGQLEVRRNGDTWAGRLKFYQYNRWEELVSVNFDPVTEKIEFVRSMKNGHQLFNGKLCGNKMAGHCTHSLYTLSTAWSAIRYIKIANVAPQSLQQSNFKYLEHQPELDDQEKQRHFIIIISLISVAVIISLIYIYFYNSK